MSNAHTAYWYRWSLLGGLATSASSILIAFYQVERAVRQLAGVQSAVRVMAVLMIVGGAWLAGFVGYIVAGILSSYLLLGGLVAVRMRSKTPASPGALPAGYFRVAALALLGTILWTAGRTADVVILDRFATDRVQFGCYALALTISGVLSMVNQTIQVVAIPFFSAHHEDGEWVLRNAGKWQIAGLLSGAVAAVALFCFGSVLVRHFYGMAYAPAIAFLIPLLLAQCLLATFHIQAGALMGLALVRINTIVAAVVVPLSIFATLLMARQYGIWGAAWAQVGSAAVYAALQSIFGWRALFKQRTVACRTGGQV